MEGSADRFEALAERMRRANWGPEYIRPVIARCRVSPEAVS